MAPRRYTKTMAGRRFLVIDDDATLARLIRRVVSRRADELVVAGTADEALRLIEQDSHFDALLCDVGLPNVGGVELRRMLKRAAPHLIDRLIWMTGDNEVRGVSEPVRRDRLLRKPFSLEDLEDAMDRVCSSMGTAHSTSPRSGLVAKPSLDAGEDEEEEDDDVSSRR